MSMLSRLGGVRTSTVETLTSRPSYSISEYMSVLERSLIGHLSTCGARSLSIGAVSVFIKVIRGDVPSRATYGGKGKRVHGNGLAGHVFGKYATRIGLGLNQANSKETALSTARLAMPPNLAALKSVWEMKSGELEAELTSYNVRINVRWTLGELRELIKQERESRGLATGKGKEKALTRLSPEELRSRAESLGIQPQDGQRPTKAWYMLQIRDRTEEAEEVPIMTVGIYKNLKFHEVPQHYVEWARAEMIADPAVAHRELRRLVAWRLQQDAEADGQIPLPPDLNRTRRGYETVKQEQPETGRSSMTARSSRMAQPVEPQMEQPRALRKAAAARGGSPKRSHAAAVASETMQRMEMTSEELAEMKEMEEKLAMMKRRHGMPAASSTASWSEVGGERRTRSTGDGEDISDLELMVERPA